MTCALAIMFVCYIVCDLFLGLAIVFTSLVLTKDSPTVLVHTVRGSSPSSSDYPGLATEHKWSPAKDVAVEILAEVRSDFRGSVLGRAPLVLCRAPWMIRGAPWASVDGVEVVDVICGRFVSCLSVSARGFIVSPQVRSGAVICAGRTCCFPMCS